MTSPFKDVVVFVPGIMGSALAREGRTVWDVSGGAIVRALASLGRSVQDLALESDSSTGEGVTATHVLADAHLIPGLWKIDGYSGIADFIQSKLEAIRGENYFEFPYDWRLDNRVSAARFQEAALGWLEDWRVRPGCDSAQLIIVAHSMGGLVSRYFLECLGGWRHTRTLITLGTPFRGSVKALDYLVNGKKVKLGPLTIMNLTELVRSLPSAYQLLPIYPCVGETPQELTRLEQLSELGELDIQRVRGGIDFHREIESAVASNRAAADFGAGYRVLPLVGAYQPTYLSALLTGDDLTPLRTYEGQSMLDGDGTVPRLSATPIELSNEGREAFLACPHASLQNFDPARTQLRAALQDVDLRELKAVALEPIALDLNDAFVTSEPVHARARCGTAIEGMQAVISALDTELTVEATFQPDPQGSDWQDMILPSLPEGAYRMEVSAGNDAEPVSDLFVVLGETL